jgi:hypothetical protein
VTSAASIDEVSCVIPPARAERDAALSRKIVIHHLERDATLGSAGRLGNL